MVVDAKRQGPAALLRHRDFRYLLASQAMMNVAIWMQISKLPWLALEQTGSHAAVGLTVASQYVPILLAGPLGGLLADRVRRRTILLTTQFAAVVPALFLALSAAAGLNFTAVICAAFAWGVLQLFDAPARQVFVLDAVPATEATRALAMSISTWHLGSAAGPLLAGGLLALANVWLGSAAPIGDI